MTSVGPRRCPSSGIGDQLLGISRRFSPSIIPSLGFKLDRPGSCPRVLPGQPHHRLGCSLCLHVGHGGFLGASLSRLVCLGLSGWTRSRRASRKLDFTVTWFPWRPRPCGFFLSALWDPTISWRTGRYRLRCGGAAEEV